MTLIEAGLEGMIIAAFLVAGLFFLKFWRSTQDFFFLAFAVFFFVEGVDRIVLFFLQNPNEGSPWIYFVRFFALLWILAAILKKNYGRGRRSRQSYGTSLRRPLRITHLFDGEPSCFQNALAANLKFVIHFCFPSYSGANCRSQPA